MGTRGCFPGDQLQVPFGSLAVRLWHTVPILGSYWLSDLYISKVLHPGAFKLASTVHHLDLLVIPSMKQKPIVSVQWS